MSFVSLVMPSASLVLVFLVIWEVQPLLVVSEEEVEGCEREDGREGDASFPARMHIQAKR